MDKIFLTVLNMSLTAGFAVPVVFLVRLLLKRAPRIYSYLLWSVILFRLMCPFSVDSAVSLLPVSGQTIPKNIMYAQLPQINSGLSLLDSAVNRALPPAAPTASVNPLQVWIFIGEMVWLAGIAVLLAYSVISSVRLRQRLSDAEKMGDHIYVTERIRTPFVFGIRKPEIYLPAGLSETEKQYILLHEQTHIRRRDHIVKLTAYLTLCVHWFNPLVWAAFAAMTKDMEMSCDETVLRRMGNGIKKEYASSLLSLADGSRAAGVIPPAFGEGGVKSRIKNVLNYKQPTVWAMVLAVLLVGAAVAGLACNPGSTRSWPMNWNRKAASPLERIYQWRTPYVGDASAVGNITDAWLPMADLKKDGFELKTDQEPYQATIRFLSGEEAEAGFEEIEAAAEANAVILFSLVENLGRIAIDIDGGTVAVYERNQAEETFGNIWKQTETYDGFRELYETVTEIREP